MFLQALFEMGTHTNKEKKSFDLVSNHQSHTVQALVFPAVTHTHKRIIMLHPHSTTVGPAQVERSKGKTLHTACGLKPF